MNTENFPSGSGFSEEQWFAENDKLIDQQGQAEQAVLNLNNQKFEKAIAPYASFFKEGDEAIAQEKAEEKADMTNPWFLEEEHQSLMNETNQCLASSSDSYDSEISSLQKQAQNWESVSIPDLAVSQQDIKNKYLLAIKEKIRQYAVLRSAVKLIKNLDNQAPALTKRVNTFAGEPVYSPKYNINLILSCKRDATSQLSEVDRILFQLDNIDEEHTNQVSLLNKSRSDLISMINECDRALNQEDNEKSVFTGSFAKKAALATAIGMATPGVLSAANQAAAIQPAGKQAAPQVIQGQQSAPKSQEKKELNHDVVVNAKEGITQALCSSFNNEVDKLQDGGQITAEHANSLKAEAKKITHYKAHHRDLAAKLKAKGINVDTENDMVMGVVPLVQENQNLSQLVDDTSMYKEQLALLQAARGDDQVDAVLTRGRGISQTAVELLVVAEPLFKKHEVEAFMKTKEGQKALKESVNIKATKGKLPDNIKHGVDFQLDIDGLYDKYLSHSNAKAPQQVSMKPVLIQEGAKEEAAQSQAGGAPVIQKEKEGLPTSAQAQKEKGLEKQEEEAKISPEQILRQRRVIEKMQDKNRFVISMGAYEDYAVHTNDTNQELQSPDKIKDPISYYRDSYNDLDEDQRQYIYFDAEELDTSKALSKNMEIMLKAGVEILSQSIDDDYERLRVQELLQFHPVQKTQAMDWLRKTIKSEAVESKGNDLRIKIDVEKFREYYLSELKKMYENQMSTLDKLARTQKLDEKYAEEKRKDLQYVIEVIKNTLYPDSDNIDLVEGAKDTRSLEIEAEIEKEVLISHKVNLPKDPSSLDISVEQIEIIHQNPDELVFETTSKGVVCPIVGEWLLKKMPGQEQLIQTTFLDKSQSKEQARALKEFFMSLYDKDKKQIRVSFSEHKDKVQELLDSNKEAEPSIPNLKVSGDAKADMESLAKLLSKDNPQKIEVTLDENSSYKDLARLMGEWWCINNPSNEYNGYVKGLYNNTSESEKIDKWLKEFTSQFKSGEGTYSLDSSRIQEKNETLINKYFKPLKEKKEAQENAVQQKQSSQHDQSQSKSEDPKQQSQSFASRIRNLFIRVTA